jgi:hypothetical protein
LAGTEKHYQDFVAKCLDWSHLTRMGPEQALLHPWMQEFLNSPNTPRNSVDRKYLKPSSATVAQSTRHAKAFSFVF